MLLGLFRISGHSMEPTLHENDTVLTSNLPYLFFSPKQGDIIVFEKDNKIIVKRIQKIENDRYFVTGDNSRDSKDFGWIKKSDILGKVIYKFKV